MAMSLDRREELHRILIQAKQTEIGLEVIFLGSGMAAYQQFMEVRKTLSPEFDDLLVKLSPKRNDALWIFHREVKIGLDDGQEQE